MVSSGQMVAQHTPVMLPEVLGSLDVRPGCRYIDATCGEGGHSQAILAAAKVGGEVLGVDADREALMVASKRLAEYGDAFTVVNSNFNQLAKIATQQGFSPAHGVLFDLGVSSLQLDVEQRGFSFRRDDPLDMRFSPDQSLTAGEIVNFFNARDIASILYRFGEEPAARKIAAAIVSSRPLKGSVELADVVSKAHGSKRSAIHPATRTFQALRIAVNDELVNLEKGLKQAVELLGFGGRVVTITYHSLEDRIVKHFMRAAAGDCICLPGLPICDCNHRPTLKLLQRKPLVPTETEVATNRRSRSAKLRVAERI